MANWSEYDIGDPRMASKEALASAVRRAGKAANQRMRELERSGLNSPAYKKARAALERTGRMRFAERTKTWSKNELASEYALLRDFLAAKTSTLSGVKNVEEKRYQAARKNGFAGGRDELSQLFRTYMTEEVEQYFSSDVIYFAIKTGTTDILGKVITEEKRNAKRRKIKKEPSRGELLKKYYKYIDKYGKR